MKPVRWLASVVGCFCLAGTAEVRGTPIVVTSSTLVARVGDPRSASGIQEVTIENVVLPFSGNLLAEAGPSRSSNTYDFQVIDSGAVFQWNTEQQRGGRLPPPGYGDFAGGHVSIGFTALENVAYDISGLLASTGPGTGMQVYAALLEAPTQNPLFENRQMGVVAPGQGYRVGLGGYLVGSPFGTLRAGQSYLFSAVYEIYPDVTDNGATASGWSLFQVTPEPATGLGTLLLMSVAVVRSRRESR